MPLLKPTMQRRQTMLTASAIIAALFLNACSKKEAPATVEVIRPVQSIKVGAQGAGALESSFAAEIRPQIESRLAFRVGGKITARQVELGATVKKGQVLLKLDPADLQLSAQASQAQVAAAKANDDVAQANLKRIQSLAAQGFVSAGGVDAALGQAKASAAALQSAQAAANVQSNASQYAVLLADASGVVTGLDAEVGQVVAAGTPIVRVSQGGGKDAVFSVPESQLASVRALVGKSIAVALWSQPSLALTATIRDVAAASDPAGRSYIVKASLAMTGNNVPLGSTGTVRLKSNAGNAGAIFIPASSIIESQGKPAVWVVDAGQAKKKMITPATAMGDSVAVIAGLSAGDEVITAGTHTLVEGQKVKSLLTVAAATNEASSAATSPVAPSARVPATPAVNKP